MTHLPQHLTWPTWLGDLPVTVDLWSCPGSKTTLSQDDWLAELRPTGRLRLAVIDGVTPWRSEHPAGEDAAVWAAGVTRAAARSLADPVAVLQTAHQALWRPDLTPSRRRPSAAACVADLSVDPAQPGLLAVSAASAADCDCWVAHPDGSWAQLTGGDALAPDWRAAWEREKQQRTFPDLAAQLTAEAAFLDAPQCRPFPALGRDEHLTPTVGSRTGVRTVVLATDGARLTPNTLTDVAGHVAAVCAGSHGDVTVLRVATVR